jgi:hypothetical protein
MLLYIDIQKRFFFVLSTERDKSVQQKKSKMGTNLKNKKQNRDRSIFMVQNRDSAYYRLFLLKKVQNGHLLK